MALTLYERDAQRAIEHWQSGDDSPLRQLFNLAMSPVDWVTSRAVSPTLLEQFDGASERFFDRLNDASKWTFSDARVLTSARKAGLDVADITELRHGDMEQLDALARAQFSENALLAAIEGGGTGLGGIVALAADLPLLFTINLRLIQQVNAAYGFSLRGPEFGPLVLAVFNAAACGHASARHQALREVTVAAAGLANEQSYAGRVTGTFSAQNRHLPREIAKSILGRKLAQTIPIAGAAVGAGVNWWFTTQTAETAWMLARALHLECKDRR